MKYKNAVVGQRVVVKNVSDIDVKYFSVDDIGTITDTDGDVSRNRLCYITLDGKSEQINYPMYPSQLRKAPAIVEVPKIKVGDRVICTKLIPCDAPYGIRKNYVGTVLEVHEHYFDDGATAIVKWDKLEQPKYGGDRHMYCAGKNTQLALLKPVDGSTVKGTKIYVHADAISCSGFTKYQGVVGVLENNNLGKEGGTLVGIRFKCGGYVGCLPMYVSEIVEIPNEV